MAILIPSRNIYPPINNDKILKNVKERIEVNATEVIPSNEYETSIYNESFYDIESKKVSETFNDKSFVSTTTTNSMGTTTGIFFACAYLNENFGYYSTKIIINKLLKNKYVSKIYNGTKEENGKQVEEDAIKYTLFGKTIRTPISAYVYQKPSVSFGNSEMSEISYGSPNEIEGMIQLPSIPNIITETHTTPNPDLVAKVTGQNNKSSYSIKEYSDYFEITIYFLSYLMIEQMKGQYETLSLTSHNIPISGEKIEYIPTEISITAYGNTIGIDLQDKLITISEEGKENSKKVFSVDNNELLQTSNYISGTNANAIEENYTKTLNAYKNGRETATLLCDINEYKDTNGNLAISTKQEGLPMTFNVGDEVIPMVFGANGKDFPMSLKNGEPKVFVVSSVKPYYDGAVWQQIEIQEKTS